MNPLLEAWTAPFGAPPLDRIKPEHFAPAYALALSQHDEEIQAIAANGTPPDFANTIIALERSGKLLARVDAVFSAFAGSLTNDALQAIELEMAPRLSAHYNAIYLNAAHVDTSAISDGILILLSKDLSVGLAVRIEAITFTAFPSGFQFGLGDVPIRATFLQNGP